MPLFKEWSPDEHSLAAVWKVEEDAIYFQEQTRLNSDIKHPRRRTEHLAGRFLLQHLKEDFPLIHISADEHDKPRLPDNRYYFSISHSHPYIAAVISDREECGIDLQCWHNSMEKIAHMFLSEREMELCNHDAALMTLAWTVKETAYKWNGRRGGDFIRDLAISKISELSNINLQEAYPRHFNIIMNCFGTEVLPKALLYKDFALSWLVKDR